MVFAVLAHYNASSVIKTLIVRNAETHKHTFKMEFAKIVLMP
jgi:hypothetical protein